MHAFIFKVRMNESISISFLPINVIRYSTGIRSYALSYGSKQYNITLIKIASKLRLHIYTFFVSSII